MISEERKNRIKELFNRSFSRGIYTYTDFLSPTGIAEVEDVVSSNNFTAFGGVDFAERKMVRFGKEEEIGYGEDFPISVIKVTLTGGKFATAITHRDVLGATLNLGIERQKLGDMFVNQGFAYIIACDSVAPLILSELNSIGKNKVICEEVFSIPEEFYPKTEEFNFSVSSNRTDSVICKVFGLSREDGTALCKDGFVYINGKKTEPSKGLNSGETVWVKGYGKFVFLGEGGLSKKGKTYVTVKKFV